MLRVFLVASEIELQFVPAAEQRSHCQVRLVAAFVQVPSHGRQRLALFDGAR